MTLQDVLTSSKNVTLKKTNYYKILVVKVPPLAGFLFKQSPPLMYKFLLTLYFICYACYIFYTRQPDYFNGETTQATITINATTHKATAHYTIASKQYNTNADYPLRKLQEGETINIIYNPSKPEDAAVLSVWGYWITWNELVFSAISLFLLFQLAVSITSNPTEESLKQREQSEDAPLRKYD